MKNVLLTVLILLLTLASCSKKQQELEIEYRGCKKMKISQPNYAFLPDTFCKKEGYGGAIRFEFQIDKGKDCFYAISLDEVTFYHAQGIEYNVGSNRSYKIDDPLVIIDNEKVSFVFCYWSNDSSTIANLTNIVVSWNIVSEYGQWSNTLTERIDFPGKPICTALMDIVKTIKVNDYYQIFKIWDHAAEDGDIVTVHFNNDKILDHYRLTKNGEQFAIILQKGDNFLSVLAENEGGSPPNTCSIEINNTEIKIDAKVNQAKTIKIVY
jgi:hypothetical protein